MDLLTPWSQYFVAEAGAAAALTGLLFVALSFNLERIATDQTWLRRAGTGLIYLAQPVVVSLVALFPTETDTPVAWTLAAAGVVIMAILTRLDPGTAGTQAAAPPAPGFVNSFRNLFARTGHERLETGARLLLTLASSITTVAGAFLLLARSPAGTYILAVGALASLILGLVTAWILLVEVRG
jgi:hypothetical protein